MLLGNIDGRIDDPDGVMVSSIIGAIVDGDVAIGDKIGTKDGRILTTGDIAGALLGMFGTALPGMRTESRICTIPLQPSIFVAKTVALSNRTGSIETVTEFPTSKVSR
jgi:hypothetical protein